MNGGEHKFNYPEVRTGTAHELRDAVARPRWLTDERLSPEHITVLRAISGQQRLKVAEQMFWTARKLKAAGVRQQHPQWSEAEITAEVNRIFLHAAG